MYDGPDFGRLRRALLLKGEPDRVPLLELLVEKDVKSAFLGKPVNDLAMEVEFSLKAGYDYVVLTGGVRRLFQTHAHQYQGKGGAPVRGLAATVRRATAFMPTKLASASGPRRPRR